jgi:dihydroorotate dehydrogenase (NAD+) catalytic subunit
MADLSVDLGRVSLKNPVIPASGTFGYGAEFWELYDLNLLGAIAVKGTTRLPRSGNPGPRVAETPSGLLNSVGLQNPGIETVLSRELPELRKHFKNPIILNVSGFCEEDYAYCCARAEDCGCADIVELNISCPNVSHGGMSFGKTASGAAEITRAARAATKKPIFVKLSPNVADIAEIARACESEGADGICLINTLLGMRIDLRTLRPVLKNIFGGLSGPAVLPVALRMVYEVYRAVKIPIIGVGGVSSADDVIEMAAAGASAVQIGSANLVDPYACKNIVESLHRVCDGLGIRRLRDAVGAAHGG